MNIQKGLHTNVSVLVLSIDVSFYVFFIVIITGNDVAFVSSVDSQAQWTIYASQIYLELYCNVSFVCDG